MSFLYRIIRYPVIYFGISVLLVLLVMTVAAWQTNLHIEKDREIPLVKVLGTYAATIDEGTVNSRAMGAAILFGLQNQDAKKLALGQLPPDAPAVSSALDTLRTLYFADTVFLVNAQGIISAYSSNDHIHGTGRDLSSLPCVQLAMRGTPNVYPIVNNNGSDRGIYLAAPLRAEMNNASRTIGVVVVKVGSDKLDALLNSWSDGIALLLSPQGVVFAASRNDWLFRLTGEISAHRIAEIQRTRHFGKAFGDTPRQALPFTLDMQEASIDGVRHAVRSLPLGWNDPEGDWMLGLLERRDNWWTNWNVLGVAGMAGLMTTLALFWLYTLARHAVLRQENYRELESAQIRLRKSESRLHAILDNSPIGIWLVGTDGRYHFVNDTFCNAVGVPESKFLSTPDLADILDPEVAASCIQSDRECLEQIEPHLSHEVLTFVDGKQHLMEITKVRLHDNTDGVDGIIGISIDITEQREREEAMKLAATVFNSVDEGVIVTSQDNLMIAVNPAFTAITGYSSDEVIGKNPRMLSARQHSSAMYQKMWAALNAAGSWQGEVLNRRKDGELYSEWLSIKVVHDENGKVVNHVAIFSDISERKKAESQLLIAATAFETYDPIMITDADANIIRVNRAFEKTTGYCAEEVIGKNPRILKSGRHDQDFFKKMWGDLLSTGSWTGEVWDRRKNGEIFPKLATISSVKNNDGETTQYVSIFTDISGRKKAEEEIHNLAFYDVLTGLPNRRLLFDRLSLALSVSARNKLYGALMFLDLDKFKTLNDTLGHDYGDMLLVEVAKRLKYCVREADTVARLGGDEFVILIENISLDAEETSQNVAHMAEKIRAVLSTTYQLNKQTLHSSPSIGVCLFSGNNESVEELVKRADMAMYQAKDSGRNTVRFFDPHMQHMVETRATLESDLRRAIPDRQLSFYYQVQLDCDLRPIGAEALIRWNHPNRGMVLPAHFIPFAEESSLILEIGDWVLDSSCRQIAAWSNSELTRSLVLAINISAHQFKQPGFVSQVAAMIQNYGIDPSRLKLELTESVALDDIDSVAEKMLTLRHKHGITFSLDDFGTGYSSLSYIKRLPLDQIKIDRGFVHDMTTSASDADMVKTIIDMAQNFGLNVIAEGVETESQLTFLRENGCLAFQGNLFGKPVPLEEFEFLLKQGAPL